MKREKGFYSVAGLNPNFKVAALESFHSELHIGELEI